MMARDTIAGTSSDFTGNLEDWEARVFRDAMHFRLHRFYGNGNHDTAEVKDFREALTLAALEVKAERRVILYAVAATGRWFQLPQKQWLSYLRVWDKEHGTGTKGGK